ncbi:MAG: hypothetical protein WBE81_09360 [Pseudolabrys sp.]
MPEAEVTFELKRAVVRFGAYFAQLQLQVVARPGLQKLTGCRLIREFQPVTVKRRSRWHIISTAQQLRRRSTVLRNPQGAFAANQLRQHVNCKLLDAVFLAARQIHGQMRDVQATGAIDEDKDSDLALPEVIRPQAVCFLASLTTLTSILPSASNRFRGVVDTVPAFRAVDFPLLSQPTSRSPKRIEPTRRIPSVPSTHPPKLWSFICEIIFRAKFC